MCRRSVSIVWWLWQVGEPQAGMGSSSTRAPPPALSQAFPITSWLVLNPLAPTFPINFGGTALWLLEGCLCVLLMAEDGDRAEIPRFFVAAASSLSSPWKPPPRRKRSQEGKTGSLFIQMPWQWIGCNYSLKYSLVLIIQVAGNRRNTGETQPHQKKLKLLIRWILHFLIVNSENIVPGICLGEGFVRAELKKNK